GGGGGSEGCVWGCCGAVSGTRSLPRANTCGRRRCPPAPDPASPPPPPPLVAVSSSSSSSLGSPGGARAGGVGHPTAGTPGPSGVSAPPRRRWRLLLLAWLSLGCGIGSAQVRGSGGGPPGGVGNPRDAPAPDLGAEPSPSSTQDPALGTPLWVPEPPAPAPPRGVWGPWGPWSSCSSSCGDGVALRTRRCLRSTEEDSCPGEPRQYRLCQLQGCPGGSVPFRAMQCSLYDNKPVLGTTARYRWVPFHGAPNLCDLNCLAVGHNFYYTFGRVLDGTRCGPGSPDLCVGGRCLSVGCDGILGSGARPDACGQCGGGHGSCLFVHRLFQGADPSSGE
uniref:ADAMTS/ADAMTS-like cysteine-rich domain-containing protein n=1 Tax=Calidris pygmaea TaxID=425635 RepID=A0A8C3PHY3_9CHAR